MRRLKPHLIDAETAAAPPWQDILVGGTVFGVVGAALAAGLKKDPVVCELCQGNGGTRWVLGGSWAMALIHNFMSG